MKTEAITGHRDGSKLNDALIVERVGEPGRGGAFTAYRIRSADEVFELRFQSQDPAIKIDGASNEALLAIVADRLVCFQQSPMACEENANALSCITRAAHFLAERTRARIAAGKEGKAEPLEAAKPD